MALNETEFALVSRARDVANNDDALDAASVHALLDIISRAGSTIAKEGGENDSYKARWEASDRYLKDICAALNYGPGYEGLATECRRLAASESRAAKAEVERDDITKEIDRLCESRGQGCADDHGGPVGGVRHLVDYLAGEDRAFDGMEAEFDRIIETIDESLPHYAYDDGTGDEASPRECVEYAGDEIKRLRRELEAEQGRREAAEADAERLAVFARSFPGVHVDEHGSTRCGSCGRESYKTSPVTNQHVQYCLYLLAQRCLGVATVEGSPGGGGGDVVELGRLVLAAHAARGGGG